METHPQGCRPGCTGEHRLDRPNAARRRTIEVLHNQHPERIHLPQSQRHSNGRRNPLNRKNGEAHILACYFASYGNHKIRAAIPTKMATKIPGIIATSMRTS